MTEHPPLKTVADLKLPRYLGTWYEIARLPMRHEPEGCTDVSAHYILLDNGNVEDALAARGTHARHRPEKPR